MAYKQFQKDAIAKIVKGYESNDKNNRFLVADEVGLGKTFIAKGVIRCLLYDHYLKEKCKDSEKTEFDFKVLYLCSNLNIAGQNKRKLGLSGSQNLDFFEQCIFGDEEFKNYKAGCDENTGSTIDNRTTMLIKQQLDGKAEGVKVEVFRKECVEILGEEVVKAKEKEVGIDFDKDKNDTISLQIIPITPNTSIKIKNGGHIEERTFISHVFKLIKNSNKTSEYQNVNGLVEIICENTDSSYTSLKKDDDEKIKNIFDELLPALEKLLSNKELNVNNLLCENYKDLAAQTTKDDTDFLWKEGWELLRKLVALASLQLLKYDFVVLDEFQNFNDVLQKANQTKLAKEQYRSQIEYIYSVLKSYKESDKSEDKDTDTDKNIEQILDCITNTFGKSELQEKKIDISEYERDFWKEKLPHFDSLEKNEWTTEAIIEKFLELSKPAGCTCNNKSSSEDSNIKDKMLKLVKAILDGNAKDRDEIIKNAYDEINGEYTFWGKRCLSPIKYSIKKEDGTWEGKTKNVEDCYGKDKVKNYYIHNYLYNMNLQSDSENFKTEYAQIRKNHPNLLMGTSYSKKPFDYFIQLFLCGENQDKPNAELILNCFQYFYKEKNCNEKSRLVWQYAHILNNLLSIDGDRFKYSYEQLEPYRNMVGLYERRINYDNDDEKMLLNHIFQNEIENDSITRILMLSATPFKMYDNNDEDSQKNASITDVCDFLDQNAKNNVTGKLLDYKNSLLNYSISNVEFDEVNNKKKEFEKSMNSIFTRMERYAVLRDMNEKWFDDVVDNSNESSELPCGQIKELKEYLKEINDMGVEWPYINFAVDSPFIGTFMHSESKTKSAGEDGYKWKAKWKKKYKDIDYKGDSKVYIAADDFVKNEKPLGLWHGVFNNTLIKLLNLESLEDRDKVNHPGAARLLWVPSCVSKDLKGPFEEHKDYGKTIIFSRYMQTPRMLACLVSYESRRRLCWMIEYKWNTTHEGGDFRKYLLEIRKDKVQENDGSVYLLIKEIIHKYKKDLADKLQENTKFKAFFENAICHYCKKWLNLQEPNRTCNQKNRQRISNLSSELTSAFINKVILNDEQGLLAIWASYGFSDVNGEDDSSTGDFTSNCVDKIIQYCDDGALSDVLNEWLYICFESNQDFGEFIGLKGGQFLSFIKQTKIKFDLYKSDSNGKIEESDSNTANLYFARCIGMSKDDDNINAVKGLQQSFNSPFAPFVFATTSMGQEGLDFHYYADRIVHWKLPSNPVDFEQREGRINRYHCLAIRKKVIEWWGNEISNEEPKDVYALFDNAFKEARDNLTGENDQTQSLDTTIKNCEMIPDWILMNKKNKESVKIKRIVPYFYISKMAKDYNRNLKILQLYRSVIGQADPEEVMERLMSGKEKDKIKELFVDFSPYSTICVNCSKD